MGPEKSFGSVLGWLIIGVTTTLFFLHTIGVV